MIFSHTIDNNLINNWCKFELHSASRCGATAAQSALCGFVSWVGFNTTKEAWRRIAIGDCMRQINVTLLLKEHAQLASD